jgi:glutathione-regulated potassium-efflux system ancillary protein KefC
MALIPILFLIRDQVFKQADGAGPSREFDEVEASGPIVLAGFGRFNQIVGRVLRSKQIPFTALDSAPERVDFVRRFGAKIFYGDPSRIEILRAARVAEARLVIVGVDGVEESVAIVKLIREHYPHVPVFARARDREHAYTLIELGAQVIVRELFHSSLEMAREVMVAVGMPVVNAQRAIERFRDHDEAQLRHQATIRDDDEALRASAVSFAAELERLFNEDAEEDFQLTP